MDQDFYSRSVCPWVSNWRSLLMLNTQRGREEGGASIFFDIYVVSFRLSLTLAASKLNGHTHTPFHSGWTDRGVQTAAVWRRVSRCGRPRPFCLVLCFFVLFLLVSFWKKKLDVVCSFFKCLFCEVTFAFKKAKFGRGLKIIRSTL